MRNAKVEVWNDQHAQCEPEQESDRRKKCYYLEGVSIGRLHGTMPKDEKAIVRWLRLADGDDFYPQPFEEIARVLREGGHENEAVAVSIAKRRQRRSKMTGRALRLRRFVDKVLDKTIGYGYRPWQALIVAAVIVAFATGVFGLAYWQGAMVPASQDLLPVVLERRDAAARRDAEPALNEEARKLARAARKQAAKPVPASVPLAEREVAAARRTPEYRQFAEETLAMQKAKLPLRAFVDGSRKSDGLDGYPAFNAFVYALDEFLPIIELHQVEYWTPDAHRPGGRFYWGFLWFVCIAGWTLSTLFVSAFTGLVKTE